MKSWSLKASASLVSGVNILKGSPGGRGRCGKEEGYGLRKTELWTSWGSLANILMKKDITNALVFADSMVGVWRVHVLGGWSLRRQQHYAVLEFVEGEAQWKAIRSLDTLNSFRVCVFRGIRFLLETVSLYLCKYMSANNFLSTWNKLESPGKREGQLTKCLHSINL